MICRNCSDQGVVMKRGVHDNNRYAFRCTCDTGLKKYPQFPIEGSCRGYVDWLDAGECRADEKAYKEGKLLLFKPKTIEQTIGDAYEEPDPWLP